MLQRHQTPIPLGRVGTPEDAAGAVYRNRVVRESGSRYARTVNQPAQSDAPSHPLVPAERLSIAAAASALCALLAVSGCVGISWIAYRQPDRFVYIAVVPALALAAIVLGVIARVRIRRSGTTGGVVLRGKGLATLGIFLGVLGGIIPTAFLLSALVTLSSLKSLAPVAERVVLAAAAQRPQSARADLSQDASNEITDARLLAVGRAIERSVGKPLKADVSIGAVMEARTRVVSAAQSGADPSALGELSPKPVVIRCERGSVIAYTLLDADALNKQQVRITDALFLLPDGSCITLRIDGPAQQVARALGLSPTPLDE